MPAPEQLEKAKLQMIQWNSRGVAEDKDPQGNATTPFDVQFNPQSLKVNYANQKAGGDQAQGGPVQFVGKGTTKLALELWFDTSVDEQQGGQPTDVRTRTARIAAFMVPSPVRGRRNQYVPPGIRFLWGSFLFEGVMDSMDENLEYFGANGVPLRAMVSVSISRQEIQFRTRQAAAEAPGTAPFEEAQAGDSVQKKTADAGGNRDWKDVAADNGIENPRQLSPGALLNLGGSSLAARASLGLTGMASLSASAGGGASFGVSAGAGASASLGTVGGVGVGAGAGAGTSANVGAGASASAGADVR